MANEALRRAMADAKVGDRQLAEACKVDIKTVGRWLADPGRFPHPRGRWAAAALLGVDETLLWPDAVKMNVKTGANREIRDVWPYRSMMPHNLWRLLIAGEKDDILLAGWTCYFLWLEVHGLPELLRKRAYGGCRIRFLIGSPDDPATAEREAVENTALTLTVRLKVTLDALQGLRDVPEIEARYADRRLMGQSVFRFGSDAIVTPHLAETIGADAPTLWLQRKQDDGMFDRFVRDHAEILWQSGRPITF